MFATTIVQQADLFSFVHLVFPDSRNQKRDKAFQLFLAFDTF